MLYTTDNNEFLLKKVYICNVNMYSFFFLFYFVSTLMLYTY